MKYAIFETASTKSATLTFFWWEGGVGGVSPPPMLFEIYVGDLYDDMLLTQKQEDQSNI